MSKVKGWVAGGAVSVFTCAVAHPFNFRSGNFLNRITFPELSGSLINDERELLNRLKRKKEKKKPPNCKTLRPSLTKLHHMPARDNSALILVIRVKNAALC